MDGLGPPARPSKVIDHQAKARSGAGGHIGGIRARAAAGAQVCAWRGVWEVQNWVAEKCERGFVMRAWSGVPFWVVGASASAAACSIAVVRTCQLAARGGRGSKHGWVPAGSAAASSRGHCLITPRSPQGSMYGVCAAAAAQVVVQIGAAGTGSGIAPGKVAARSDGTLGVMGPKAVPAKPAPVAYAIYQIYGSGSDTDWTGWLARRGTAADACALPRPPPPPPHPGGRRAPSAPTPGAGAGALRTAGQS